MSTTGHTKTEYDLDGVATAYNVVNLVLVDYNNFSPAVVDKNHTAAWHKTPPNTDTFTNKEEAIEISEQPKERRIGHLKGSKN